MSRQSSSDPLPYVQVDRAVKPKAGLLADTLGVSRQHALGSLIEFWELCGDPRELEAIVLASPDAERHAVVLSGEECAARFRLASGRDLDASVLVRLGLLEQRPDGFRVRGMSRYFEPVRKRLQARLAASAGGKARAGAPRIGGRFVAQTTVTGAGEPAGGSAGDTPAVAPGDSQPATSRPPAETPAAGQPTATRGPGLAVSGQRSASERGSMSSPLQRSRAGSAPNEDKNSRWASEADAFVAWASRLDPTLANPGQKVREWARGFFEKFQPADQELPRQAFMKFLVWASMTGKSPGWGLWLSDSVWEPRWAEVRASRGAA